MTARLFAPNVKDVKIIIGPKFQRPAEERRSEFRAKSVEGKSAVVRRRHPDCRRSCRRLR